MPGDDKPRYIGTIMWRHKDRFVNLKGHGYWVADEPYEPAGYDPEKARQDNEDMEKISANLDLGDLGLDTP
jgi:hypothetical protein